jgi:TolA-binding protein
VQSYTRRQLKEDKFADTAQGAVQWATGHRSVITWTVAALAVAAIVVGGLYLWNSQRTEQANIALSKALQTYTAPIRPAGSPPDSTSKSFTSIAERAKQAEKELQAIAEKYPYTKPGRFAAYMAATSAIQAGDTNGAEQQLKSMASSYDKGVASLAKLALAGLYRSTNRVSDAARIYKDLSDHPTETVPKAEAQLQLADLYASSDPKEAANIYQQIQKENPNSMAAQVAASKLAKTGK